MARNRSSSSFAQTCGTPSESRHTSTGARSPAIAAPRVGSGVERPSHTRPPKSATSTSASTPREDVEQLLEHRELRDGGRGMWIGMMRENAWCGGVRSSGGGYGAFLTGPLPRRLRRSFLAARGDPSPNSGGGVGCYLDVCVYEQPLPRSWGRGRPPLRGTSKRPVGGEGPSETRRPHPPVHPFTAAPRRCCPAGCPGTRSPRRSPRGSRERRGAEG